MRHIIGAFSYENKLPGVTTDENSKLPNRLFQFASPNEYESKLRNVSFWQVSQFHHLLNNMQSLLAFISSSRAKKE